MAYIRGEHYAWMGGCDRKHLPGGPPQDNEGHERPCTCDEHDYLWYGGIEIPVRIFDSLVVMRHAELVAEGRLEEMERHVIENYRGNVNSWAVQEKHGGNPAQDLTDFLDQRRREREEHR